MNYKEIKFAVDCIRRIETAQSFSINAKLLEYDFINVFLLFGECSWFIREVDNYCSSSYEYKLYK